MSKRLTGGFDQAKAQEATIAVARAMKDGFTPQEIHLALMANLATCLAAGANECLGTREVGSEEKEALVQELAEWSRKKHYEMMARHQGSN